MPSRFVRSFFKGPEPARKVLNLPPPFVQNIGCLAAYPFSPYMSDGLGRRAAVIFGATIMCIATVLQTASHSVGMFIGAR